MPRPLAVLLAAVAAALLLAPAASAGVLTADPGDCTEAPSSQVFAPWGDPASYFLVPDGGFEAGGAGWDLDGAQVVAGNQAFGAGAASLRLPAGASATSPTVCVGLEHPTSRFFVRRTSAGLLPSLRVEAETLLADGTPLRLPVGVVAAGQDWAPSPIVVNVVNLLPLLPGGRAPLRLRFTAVGATFGLDDVHVDPYGRK